MLINFNLNSAEEITKKYFHNVFGGGKEKIIVLEGDRDSIDIYYARIRINLFDNYSDVSIIYRLKNNGKDAKILFAFPKIDASLNKIIGNKNIKNKKIFGAYLNYSISINGKRINYNLKEDNQIELNLPYKIGDYYYKKSNNKSTVYEEMVDSYYYTYSWHVSSFDIKNDESKTISISYTTPHYYNVIDINNIKKNVEIEDPALKYLLLESKKSKKYISEKIFIYNFSTVYSDYQKNINKVLIKLKANIIDQDYLKILPINYRKIGNNYYWKYKNFKALPINNMLVKISPVYSKDTINPLCFIFFPNKKQVQFKSYFELDKINNEIILEYKDYKNSNVKFSKIRIFPDYYDSKYDLKKMNKPLQVQLEFSDSPSFYNSTKVIEKIRNKKFVRSIKRKSYVEIYDGKEISCKYIKIKVLNTSKDIDIVKISDIQILK
jgi:hypothetical protein